MNTELSSTPGDGHDDHATTVTSTLWVRILCQFWIVHFNQTACPAHDRTRHPQACPRRSHPGRRRPGILAVTSSRGAHRRRRAPAIATLWKHRKTSASCSRCSTNMRSPTSSWGVCTSLSWRPPQYRRHRYSRAFRPRQCQANPQCPGRFRLRLSITEHRRPLSARSCHPTRISAGSRRSADLNLGRHLGASGERAGIRPLRKNICPIYRTI
jgi:hypothetical protein